MKKYNINWNLERTEMELNGKKYSVEQAYIIGEIGNEYYEAHAEAEDGTVITLIWYPNEEDWRNDPDAGNHCDWDNVDRIDGDYASDEAKEIASRIKAADQWDDEDLKELCTLAGMEKEYEEADGDDFEKVVFAAAEKLGVEII